MKIEIKKSNIGKFTATKSRTGKSTEQLTHSKNPLTRKRAVFAQNAKHWKHDDGGYMDLIFKAEKGGKLPINQLKYDLGGPVTGFPADTDALYGGGFINSILPQTHKLIDYKTGGTHAQNPLGGIPLSMSSNGKRNTVEQGETSFKFKEGKYIFSNRLRV